MAGQNQMTGGFEVFEYDELAKVTLYFSLDCSLGSGSCGDVFLGKIKGRDVAIKKLKFNKNADKEEERKKFESEFLALSTVNHTNLVKLIGYCSKGRNRLIVCEYCSNHSLHWHLHGDPKATTLSWSKRMKIAIGSAEGIAYLHECQPKIIHRDIKPENIVLEQNFQAKVVDFGLARFFPIGDKTHISSLLRGTSIYADPEHKPTQRVSEKSDVYSFGVVLLELISGRESEFDVGDVQKLSIIEWAKHPILQALGPENNIEELIDPKLEEIEKELHINEIKMMICCAAASVYRPSKDRPQMKKIVQALKMEIPPNEIWDMNFDAALLGPK